MDVVLLSPAYPPEMPDYVRGLHAVGARVLGVGDSPAGGLPEQVRSRLAGYLQVPSIMDADDVRRRVAAWLGGRRPHRVEALWEPLVLTAAQLREDLGVAGMTVDTVLGFRDKQLMKERIAAAGLRVPRSHRASSAATVRAAATAIGYPVIVKPIDGAGSADTHRVHSPAELERILPTLVHVREVSVEEFVEGDEFTFDALCVDGRPVYVNVAQYLPRPLVARTEHWISPVIITIRDLSRPDLQEGLRLGHGVVRAMGMGTGIVHMEWYRKADGEVVFGEIGCRPGGAHLVDQMNFTGDIDLYTEWARAVCLGEAAPSNHRKYNCAIIFKRAAGSGIIREVHGLGEFMARHGSWVCRENLLRVGQHRRDWKKTLVSDGFLIVRHPDWDTALGIAHDAATDVRMFAG